MQPTGTIQPPTFDAFSQVQYQHEATAPPVYDSVSDSTMLQQFLFESAWTTLFGVSLVLSFVLAVGIVYAMLRVRQIRDAERAHYQAQPMSRLAAGALGVEQALDSASAHDIRWRDIVAQSNSEKQNDWKHAILDADVMLDAAITARGYTGESLGERMKQVSRADVNSIDDAWEAHKIRNRIAHEGSEMALTHREARRAILLYERVLKELAYISG